MTQPATKLATKSAGTVGRSRALAQNRIAVHQRMAQADSRTFSTASEKSAQASASSPSCLWPSLVRR